MSWRKLLAARHIAAEPTSKEELDELRRKVALNLKDAQVAGVSAQGRFEAADSVFAKAVANFDLARNKRNNFSYDEPTEISETDAADLVAAVKEFERQAEEWIAKKQQALV